jgi:hypothetical protein
VEQDLGIALALAALAALIPCERLNFSLAVFSRYFVLPLDENEASDAKRERGRTHP